MARSDSIFSRLSGLLLFIPFCLTGLDPAPVQNYCPVVIVNRTGQMSSQIYLVIHGNDNSGLPCFLVPNAVTGLCGYVYPTPAGANGSAASSVLLSNLPAATNTGIADPAFLIYLPFNSSSRAYFSINQPMYLATEFNPATGVFGIDDASVTTLTDPNFYTLYQDIEFGLNNIVTNSSSQLFLNLSWVDYFCLPMQFSASSYSSTPPHATPINVMPTPADPNVPTAIPSGTSGTRESIISTTNTNLARGDVTHTTYPAWSTLGIHFYPNPYTDKPPAVTPSYLRILAAKNSVDFGTSGTKFNGAADPQLFFPSDYVTNTTYGPVTGQSFYQTVYQYYQSNSLFARIFPAGVSATTIYQINSSPTNLVLQFTDLSGAGQSCTLNLSSLSMSQLLSGATWPFLPPSTSVAYTNELSKLISALFTAGQFPLMTATSQASPFVNNNNAIPANPPPPPGFNYLSFTYFKNPTNYLHGPWYNLYDQVLHPQMIDTGVLPLNPTFGQGYAYDFDDLLGLSGLISGLPIQDQYGCPTDESYGENPYIIVSLETIDGAIPNIGNDIYQFQTTVAPAPNGVTVTFLYYLSSTGSLQTTMAPIAGNTSLGNVYVDSTHPFRIRFSFDSIDYTYNVNLLRQIVTPISTTSSFSKIDLYFQNSVTFTINGGTQANPTFFIQYTSSPPPWPG